jgi:A/G-specific adenine glycosylase
VREQCRAHALGRQHEIPAPRRKAPSREQDLWAIGLRFGGRLLLERRPDHGLLAGLWCLPLLERDGDDAPIDAVSESLGVPIRFTDPPARPVRHVFTHRVWYLRPWACDARRRPRIRARDDGRTLALVAPGERPEGGIPSVTQKLLARLGW